MGIDEQKLAKALRWLEKTNVDASAVAKAIALCEAGIATRDEARYLAGLPLEKS